MIHRATWNYQEYRDFFSQNRENLPVDKAFASIRGLERIAPEVFGLVPADALKFFALYQPYDSLGKAIAELTSSMIPCCLTHNDLKLNNILLHNDWEQIISSSEPSNNSIIRLIDWERCAWGDPAFDLGMLIASYLQIWLNSLVNGLLEARAKGDESPEGRMASIFQQFSQLGIDYSKPYLNANSQDICSRLDYENLGSVFYRR